MGALIYRMMYDRSYIDCGGCRLTSVGLAQAHLNYIPNIAEICLVTRVVTRWSPRCKTVGPVRLGGALEATVVVLCVCVCVCVFVCVCV